jgi:hypothetical protein
MSQYCARNLLNIRKISGSVLGQQTGYPDWGVSWFYLVPSDTFQRNTSHQGTADRETPFPVACALITLSFGATYSEQLKASLNEPKNSEALLITVRETRMLILRFTGSCAPLCLRPEPLSACVVCALCPYRPYVLRPVIHLPLYWVGYRRADYPTWWFWHSLSTLKGPSVPDVC